MILPKLPNVTIMPAEKKVKKEKKEREWKCPKCLVIFPDHVALRQHILEIHSMGKLSLTQVPRDTTQSLERIVKPKGLTRFLLNPPHTTFFLVLNERYDKNKTFILQCYGTDFVP